MLRAKLRVLMALALAGAGLSACTVYDTGPAYPSYPSYGYYAPAPYYAAPTTAFSFGFSSGGHRHGHHHRRHWRG
jgi:hypothetical protein